MSNKVMLILVLNKVEYLDKLLLELNDEGIQSATVLRSAGMMQQLAQAGDEQIISTLRPLFTPNHSENKTIFMLLDEEEVETARKVINEVIGGLSKPETGILFAIPTLFTEGIRQLDNNSEE